MQFASSSEVAKLPRLVPLPLACIRRGTRIQPAPAARVKYTPTNSVLTDKPRNPFTFANTTVLTACWWKYHRKGMARSSRCGSRAAAAAALQWQAVDEAFLLPPLLSHFGCRHRRCDSDRFTWNKPFQFVHRGERRVGMERGCPQQLQHQRSSSIERHSSVGTNGRRWGRTYTEALSTLR